MVVEEGFLGDGLRGQEVFELGLGDFLEGQVVDQECGEFAEGIVIVGEGVR